LVNTKYSKFFAQRSQNIRKWQGKDIGSLWGMQTKRNR